MFRPTRMDDHGRLRMCGSESTGAAGVIEVNVGDEDERKVFVLEPLQEAVRR